MDNAAITKLEATMEDGPRNQTSPLHIEVTHQLKSTGTLLAQVEKEVESRKTELQLYRSIDGHYLCVKRWGTGKLGESSIGVYDTVPDVINFFGAEEPAMDLYTQAGIDPISCEINSDREEKYGPVNLKSGMGVWVMGESSLLCPRSVVDHRYPEDGQALQDELGDVPQVGWRLGCIEFEPCDWAFVVRKVIIYHDSADSGEQILGDPIALIDAPKEVSEQVVQHLPRLLELLERAQLSISLIPELGNE